MARKGSPTILQEELYPLPGERSREAIDDARMLDLDADQESPFLRGQKRVSARRGPLPKKTASLLMWVAFSLGVLFLCSVVGSMLYHYGEHSWRFRVQSSDDIEISGLHNVTRGQVMEVMGEDIGRNIFFVPLAERKAKLEQVPWVESASVMRFVPNRLQIEIHERTPVAFARVGSKVLLVDAGGTLMDLPGAGKKKYSFPVILGMNPGEPLSITTPLPNLVGSPARVFNAPNGVNNNGVAAGTAATTFFGSSPMAVIWKNNFATAYPLPAGESFSRANSINIAETAVGSVDSGSAEQAAVYTIGGSTVMTQTMPNGGVLKTAFGINDAGRIVGQALDPNNAAVTSGFFIDPGDPSATDIGALTALGHNSAIPFGVSSDGRITGSSSLNSGSGSRPFIWVEGIGMTEVPLPVGTTTGQGRGVNDDGWVVGNSSAATSVPFLYDGVTSVSLQSLLVNAPGWDLVSGTSNAGFSISDNGVITGRGLLNGVVTGFVMVPVPEPTAAALAVIGGITVTVLRLRRRRVR